VSSFRTPALDPLLENREQTFAEKDSIEKSYPSLPEKDSRSSRRDTVSKGTSHMTKKTLKVKSEN